MLMELELYRHNIKQNYVARFHTKNMLYNKNVSKLTTFSNNKHMLIDNYRFLSNLIKEFRWKRTS